MTNHIKKMGEKHCYVLFILFNVKVRLSFIESVKKEYK